MVFDMMKEMIPIKSYRKSRLDGDFVIVMSNDMDIYFLNEMANNVISQIDNNKTLGQISHDLLAEYNVESDTLNNDLVGLIRELQWKQIVRLKKPN